MSPNIKRRSWKELAPRAAVIDVETELLRAYPGGIAGLARDSGLSDSTVRRIAAGAFVRPPWDRLRALAACPGWRAMHLPYEMTPAQLLAFLPWRGGVKP